MNLAEYLAEREHQIYALMVQDITRRYSEEEEMSGIKKTYLPATFAIC